MLIGLYNKKRNHNYGVIDYKLMNSYFIKYEFVKMICRLDIIVNRN